MEVGMGPKIRDIRGRNCALSGAYLNPSVEAIDYFAAIDDLDTQDVNGVNAFMQAAMRDPRRNATTR
jgi:hypothetical protein